MNRQSVSKAEKPKNSMLPQVTDTVQHTTKNLTDFGASIVDTWSTLEQQIDKPSLPSPGSNFNHDFSKIFVRSNSSFPIQAKLKIGQPNDRYEQEADRVAEQVMRMPEPLLSSSVEDSSLANSSIPRGKTIQRTCASCSTEYKKAKDEKRPVQPLNLCPKCRTQGQELLQTKPITPLIQAKTIAAITPEVTPSISSGIHSLQGGGRPLSRSERGFFEPRFGADFSNVRIHNDTRAASAAQSVNSRAFTLGHNVVFGAGEYSPDVSSGRKLLAHELTHVVQQNGGANFKNNIAPPQIIPVHPSHSDMLARYTLDDCEVSDHDLIKKADTRATSMTRNALSTLKKYRKNEQVGAGDKKVGNLLSDYFGFESGGRFLDVVIKGYSKVFGELIGDNYQYECEDDCDGSYAYVYGVWTDIHICMNHSSNKKASFLAHVMVHEMSHYAAGTDDLEYFYSGSPTSTSLHPTDAVSNAESYEAFAAELYKA